MDPVTMATMIYSTASFASSFINLIDDLIGDNSFSVNIINLTDLELQLVKQSEPCHTCQAGEFTKSLQPFIGSYNTTTIETKGSSGNANAVLYHGFKGYDSNAQQMLELAIGWGSGGHIPVADSHVGPSSPFYSIDLLTKEDHLNSKYGKEYGWIKALPKDLPKNYSELGAAWLSLLFACDVDFDGEGHELLFSRLDAEGTRGFRVVSSGEYKVCVAFGECPLKVYLMKA